MQSVPEALRCEQTPRGAAHTTRRSTLCGRAGSVSQRELHRKTGSGGDEGLAPLVRPGGPAGSAFRDRPTFALLGRVCDDSQVHGLDLPTERMRDAARRGPVHKWERLIGNGAKWERLSGNGAKWERLSGCGAKWERLSGNGAKWERLSGNGAKWERLSGNGAKWERLRGNEAG